MKFGVVVFPGSNCDRDVIGALKNNLNQDVIELWHKDEDLSGFTSEDCILLPGGFSYGDYLRCGAIARFSPMMKSVTAFAKNGGKVIGICNGFQILCESGLLPGVLLPNENQQFICKNVFLKSQFSSEVYKIPIAHGEGRYFASQNQLAELEAKNLIIYKYCNSEGVVSAESNHNGAANNIAGIKNEAGNVFGLMPHPERACDPLLGNTDGISLFEELLNTGFEIINN